MARPGRNRKQARRTKAGQLSRAGAPRHDHGTERTAAHKAIYGTNGCDAIGRAAEKGLLGADCAARLNAARGIAKAYWAHYGEHPIRCTLGGGGGGSGGGGSIEAERWLVAKLEQVESKGRDVRRAFDHLCIDIHPDQGPPWLDRLIDNDGSPSDAMMLKLALVGIDAVCA